MNLENIFINDFSSKETEIEIEIEKIIRDYWITIDQYLINDDGKLDVNGSVSFPKSMSFLKELPLKFNKVNGNFDCSNLSLESLQGCPSEVGGTFDCSYNKLPSLEYLPKKASCFIFDNTVKSLFTGGINCNFNKVVLLFRTDDPKVILQDIITRNSKFLDIIFKYQNYYDVWNWNGDNSFNMQNFDELIEDIIDGLE